LKASGWLFLNFDGLFFCRFTDPFPGGLFYLDTG